MPLIGSFLSSFKFLRTDVRCAKTTLAVCGVSRTRFSGCFGTGGAIH